MITAMAKVRVMAPRGLLHDVLYALLDFGKLHLAPPPEQSGVSPVRGTGHDPHRARQLVRAIADIDASLAAFPVTARGQARPAAAAGWTEIAHWARLARRTRRAVESALGTIVALEEERSMLEKYRHFFATFQPLIERAAHWKNVVAYQVVLRDVGRPEAVEALRTGIREAVGDGFDLLSDRLPTGELAMLVVVPASASGRVEALLAKTRVEEIPLPGDYAGKPLGEALPAMVDRLETIPAQVEAARNRISGLASTVGDELRSARSAMADRLAEVQALAMVGATAHAVIIDGWVPAVVVPRMRELVRSRFGEQVVIDEVAREDWACEEAPVILHNPRIFRPFELLIRMLPLPRYGTIDPTPFVAVFFPMLFGLILGDIGYGAVMALGALLLRWRSVPGSTKRAVAEVAGAASAFSIIFGVLFGEAFGDAGRHLFGLRPLLFDREEALLPFLALAIAIGLVHVLTGLVLGMIAALHQHPRHAIGKGVTALMIVLLSAAILAAFEILPEAFFTPLIIALLVAFPVLVLAEGLLAPLELLSTVGNILSYARVMAIGTASVMMAVVANKMTGMLGSVVVGALFGLLFHLVNFALGLFSPTIHALRLHYVEFFGKFYSPGGTRYRPFGHAGTTGDSTG